jgi:hypothetical protein
VMNLCDETTTKPKKSRTVGERRRDWYRQRRLECSSVIHPVETYIRTLFLHKTQKSL